MRVVEVETYRTAGQLNVVVVVVHGDDGSVGLGDTFYGASAVEHYIHEVAAPILLGSGDISPQRVSLDLSPYVGYQGSGAEMRANSAVDIALWDLLGRMTGQPVLALLGGAVRSDVPVYNTCAGSHYVRTTSRQHTSNWGVDVGDRPFEDLRAFLTEPGRLAQDLLDEGIRGMKIWPFDQAAEETNGCHIGQRALDEGCRLVAEIRDTVGDEIEVMIELHGLWNLPSAVAVVKALEPYKIRWVEDPIRPDAAGALARLKNETAVPIAVGETVTGSRGYLPLLTGGGLDIAIVDAAWTGGITAARKVASLVDSFGLPITPHDATGPMGLMAGIHLNLSQPNGFVQEIVRAFYHGWYQELVVGLPEITNGRIAASDRPGFGVELARGLAERPDISVRSTTLSDLG